ncbi:MAG: menaquinone biosynthetic enzyme MqnA/MqnD family protein [Pyrinomonadaceae bacterium]
MRIQRISASSYSNTAPLVWSFLYGKNHGKLELILDNAPARSAELLTQDRVDAALVPVICAQTIDNVRVISGVCVGARDKVRSVCLVTDGKELTDVRSVALDTSSRTSSVLTKIIFREFLGGEPKWIEAEPDVDKMLSHADAALIIGDPALTSADRGSRTADSNPRSKIQNLNSFDLAELWHQHTGLGFVFAMWMTRLETCSIDFAAARDEGLAHIDEIASNYSSQIGQSRDEMKKYLTESISYTIDETMQQGMELYFTLAEKHGLIDGRRELTFV